MKLKFILLILVLMINALPVWTANFNFLPYTVKQPDGAVINFFV